MEQYFNSQQESILLGYNNPQFRRSSTNPSTPQRNSDVDFNDVFGGPPRRSLVNETVSGEEGGEAGWCRWPSETREKPVFGEDSGIRRRHQSRNNDFFDDIFGGDESPSVCSTPKKRDSVDPFASPSTLLSPARLAIEPLASSLPPSFSLPAKLTKGVDLRTYGSPTRSWKQLEVNDGIAASNGLNPSDSHPSRFSTQTTQHNNELKNDSKPSYRQSLLSKEFLNLSLSDEADKGSNMKHNTSISEVSPNSKTSNGQFHFSIYKWASKGVPLAMPLRTERTSRTKDKLKLEKCSSTKDWIVSEITTENDSPIGSSLTKNEKQAVSTKQDVSTTIKNMANSHQTVEQIVSTKAQSDSLSSPRIVIKDVPGSPISSDARAESSTHSTSEIVFNGKTEEASETKKLESKSLHSLFGESVKKQDYDEITRMVRGENMMKSSKKLSSVVDVPLNPKKQDEKQKTVSLRSVGFGKANSQGSLSPSKNTRKGRASGKVKEFVQIFNQETVTKPRVDSKSRLNDSTYKQKGALRENTDVEGYPDLSKIEISTIETTSMSTNNLSPQDDISVSAAVPDMSFAVTGDKDESFHENFTVQVLEQDEDEVLLNQQNQEIQVIDNKIQQWSKGKEGNIRSLLSTLQYVLWSECGWKPVPLIDIIEGNAVKRAYQRALLCLHPDKLQQKGAASDQKYIAEKVFDILQEAWTQFNMLGAL